jgi:hypothetical protein
VAPERLSQALIFVHSASPQAVETKIETSALLQRNIFKPYRHPRHPKPLVTHACDQFEPASSAVARVWMSTQFVDRGAQLDQRSGCIHTHHIGVIIDPTSSCETEKSSVPEASDRHDKTLRGYKTQLKATPEKAKALAALIIKNTYRTLMTRGIKDCYIYCSDAEKNEYFRSRISTA